jgi:asparagine synthase (glutamine-hydrolysing)
MKIQGSVTKHILRKAVCPLLPAEVLTQRKAGFAAPVDYWLANELRGMSDDLLSENQIKSRGFFEPKIVRRYVSEQRSGRKDWSFQIWQLLTLELWMQTFMD